MTSAGNRNLPCCLHLFYEVDVARCAWNETSRAFIFTGYN